MGLDTETVRFLLASKRAGGSFRRCVTLGRQNLFLGRTELSMLLKEYGYTPEDFPRLLSQEYSRFRYSEDFWEMMGTEKLVMLDASNFEGANYIHDLNKPIPDDLKESFDAVCDFGTLEHVFNFPTALKSCMEMVALGGHIYFQTPANNQFGHGFYQFSPELFFSALSEANGFELERMVAVEHAPGHRWFEVANPEANKARVTLVNFVPVALYIRARRTRIVPVLSQPPQQSDYVAHWAGSATPEQSGVIDRFSKGRWVDLKTSLIERAPRLARFLEGLRYTPFNREWSFRNRNSFTPVKDKRKWR